MQLKEDKKEVKPEAGESAVDSMSPEDAELVRQMMDLGLFYGRSKSRTNPKMRPFVLTNRSGFGVINLKKTLSSIRKVEKVIGEVVKSQGSILLVGTSPSAKGIIKSTAKELDVPYVTERWLGGTLTNYETLSKRIKHFRKLKEDKASGEWEKYTKKEKLKLGRELFKLDRLFGGISDLDKIPALMFIADLTNNEIAAKEAREVGVKVVGILNTDADPNLVDYGIPANDKNRKAVEFLVAHFKEVILAAREKIPAVKVEEKQEKPKEEKDKK